MAKNICGQCEFFDMNKQSYYDIEGKKDRTGKCWGTPPSVYSVRGDWGSHGEQGIPIVGFKRRACALFQVVKVKRVNKPDKKK